MMAEPSTPMPDSAGAPEYWAKMTAAEEHQRDRRQNQRRAHVAPRVAVAGRFACAEWVAMRLPS